MVQLRVTDGTQVYFIDLYEEANIKLTLSIEDITTAETKSVFSRAFRVPATGNNNLFFEHAFMLMGTDYDVTVKKPASILVDGAEFRNGHIRLQKIYWNGDQDKIDYEIIFLGETRDFASTLGDASLCSLNLSSLSHVLNATNVELSWEAYPSTLDASGATITPSFTNGLKNGDVIYPLVDFGSFGDGTNSNPTISVTGSHNFTNNDLPVTRMKPMVRAKAVVDAIFDSTEYSYETGGFFDTDLFKQMYVSAWGDVARQATNIDFSDNICEAIGNETQGIGAGIIVLQTPVEIFDNNNNFNNLAQTYTAPLNGTYQFRGEALYTAQQETTGQPNARLQIYKNGGLIQSGFENWNQVITVVWSGALVAGDVIQIRVNETGISDAAQIRDQKFQCQLAPGELNVAAQFDCDYKQIDFIKDLLTSFRLVMAPDKINPKQFIIEPWVDYIGRGDFYDWSDKLDRSKDLVIQPLFNDQQDIIYFDHKEDKDFLNKYHVDAYKYVYGHLEFDSGNDLLVGDRKIETLWAPTPMKQIRGASTTQKFIIPQIWSFESTENPYLVIKPKTRLLFYNGLNDNNHNYEWRLDTGANSPYDIHPLVSYSSDWPLTDTGQILNWFNDIGYWGDDVAGFPPQGGQSMYQTYWSAYISSLYDKNARRVTGTFILNNADLQDFTFDDIIFIDGIYYRPEKIMDAPIGERSQVKVQLIKLLDFKYRST